MTTTLHTYPVADLIEHELRSDACVCGPVVRIYDEGGCQVIHHSLDGRELREPGYRPPAEDDG